ncbi:MAG: hypothetical protein LUC43_02720 [Burkholderiales bacterium]|nr:hypothetical protein [Burkholderiales bacterium]
MELKRRTFCAAAISSIALPVMAQTPAKPQIFSEEYPKLRCGTDLEAIYNNFLEKGFGISKYGKDNPLPKIVIATDTQCPWCAKMFIAFEPMTDKINFIWYPVAVLRDASVAQAAYILQSGNPWTTFTDNEENFKNETKGLDVSGKDISLQYRNEVWDNSKIFRRGGGTVVPLGIYKNPAGKYIPFFEPFKKLEDLK